MAKKAPTAEEIEIAESAIALVSKQVKYTIAEYPISVYVSRFEDDETGRFYVPEYQRKLAWRPQQQSEFIESLLVGLPIPVLLSESRWPYGDRRRLATHARYESFSQREFAAFGPCVGSGIEWILFHRPSRRSSQQA